MDKELGGDFASWYPLSLLLKSTSSVPRPWAQQISNRGWKPNSSLWIYEGSVSKQSIWVKSFPSTRILEPSIFITTGTSTSASLTFVEQIVSQLGLYHPSSYGPLDCRMPVSNLVQPVPGRMILVWAIPLKGPWASQLSASAYITGTQLFALYLSGLAIPLCALTPTLRIAKALSFSSVIYFASGIIYLRIILVATADTLPVFISLRITEFI